tara:strand:+ start:517 stop:939 length:423 start_codon:yes stop_codon:yes gene_type:complete
MAAQKGALLVLKIGNGGSPESFTTVAGLRSTSISLNDETVDVTNKGDGTGSSNKRTLLAGAGVNSVSISGSGVFTDDATETTLKNAWASGSLTNYQVFIPDFGTYQGAFQLTSLEYAGEFNGEVTYSVSLESSGTIAFST